MPLGIVHAASEAVGFAKTGGLADVVGSLPRALAQRGHRCLVVLPLYCSARYGKLPIHPTDHSFAIFIGRRWYYSRLWQSTLPDSEVTVYLVEQPELFERDDPAQGRGIYSYTLPGGQRQDYQDNCTRFIFFCRAVLEAIRLLDWQPDVLHCHDWQTGLVPVLLREAYQRHAPPELQQHYGQLRTVYTIHNIAYQGCYAKHDYPLTGLDWRLFNYRQMEFYSKFSFLKAGIVFADWITTVSPTYAEEIQTPYYSYGMHGPLAERRDRLTGIVNGVDYSRWDPGIDSYIPETYNASCLRTGKVRCKLALQQTFALAEDVSIPLLGVVARLVEQKGIDLVARCAGTLVQGSGAQLVILGEGDPVYHRRLKELHDRYPDRVGLTLGFDEGLAHQIEAGADMFLMPSQYEPSGLNQLYSLKYGTVPVVRACGGLADTIVDYSAEGLSAGRATGFRFLPYTPTAFLSAVQRAINLFRNDPDEWLKLQRNGMSQDWSWDRSAAEYEKVYSR